MVEPEPGAAEFPGLLSSLRRLAASLTGALQTRLQLLATEVEEERVRLGRLLLLYFITCFFFALGILTLTVFFIVLFWDTHRLLVTGLLAVIYLAAGASVAYVLRREAANGSRLFSASLKELTKDHERLNSP